MKKKKNQAATISVPAAAARAGVGLKLIRSSIESGLIPAIKIGTRWRVLAKPFESMFQTLSEAGEEAE